MYPTLNELFEEINGEDYNQIINTLKVTEKLEVSEYIAKQKRIIREDFLIPLRDYVCKLKKYGAVPYGPEIFKDVCIVLNADFIIAKRHEMLFVDVFGKQRSREDNKVKLLGKTTIKLSSLKSGSLLLLTTNSSFENLILATVTYTEEKLLRLGYVSKFEILS